MKLTILSIATLLTLSACASQKSTEVPDLTPGTRSIDHKAFLESALNAEYSLASHPVRSVYADARKNFRITLSNGVYQSEDPALLRPYDHARFLSEFAVTGRLVDSSEKENFVGALLVGSGESSELEIVVLEQSGSLALHRVSYPLGHADLQSLKIKNGFIHAIIRHRLASDPAERTTEYVLGPREAPTKM